MSMSVSMAAMMLPTAAPFFFAYWRDSRSPAGVALLILVYAAVWALIGEGVDFAMGMVMIPTSTLVALVAIAFAAAYTLAPWSRWARARCREMCGREARGNSLSDAVRDGLRYSASCVVCSAGVMVAVIVLGMANLVAVIAGAALILALKLTDWPAPVLSTDR